MFELWSASIVNIGLSIPRSLPQTLKNNYFSPEFRVQILDAKYFYDFKIFIIFPCKPAKKKSPGPGPPCCKPVGHNKKKQICYQ